MKLSSKWAEHTEFIHGEKPRIKKGECSTCECMITEPHSHCGVCGKLTSRGSGEVLASYSIKNGKLSKL